MLRFKILSYLKIGEKEVEEYQYPIAFDPEESNGDSVLKNKRITI